MMILTQWIATAIALAISAYILPGVIITDLATAILAGLILALINIGIKPLFLLLTLPINILTLGLFTFFVNGLLIMLTSALVSGFSVKNIWWAILLSIIVSIITAAFLDMDKKT